MPHDVKPDTLEHFILYCAYAKAQVKAIQGHIRKLTDSGVIDEAEMALIDALLIGFAKTDQDFEEVIKQCTARSDKADHLVLAINQVLKNTGLEK